MDKRYILMSIPGDDDATWYVFDKKYMRTMFCGTREECVRELRKYN